MRELLIDADSIVFKAGCANEEREYKVLDGDTELYSCKYKKDAEGFAMGNEDLVIQKVKHVGELSHSIQNAKTLVEKILDSIPHKNYKLFIKGKGNFRDALYKEYKAHRSDDARPEHEQQLREYLIRKYSAEEVHGEEADDKVSYIQCSDIARYCIVGVDKDLWNTPGEHFNYDTGVLDYVSMEQANYNFWKQMLTGDTADNIPGIKGIGPQTAEKILKGPKANCAAEVMYQYRK